jgi:hypothetical protein
MQQAKRKPHWVSQFLTTPWEVNTKRELVFFDFAAGHLGRPTPSKRLFRENRKRPADLEERLNSLIETPFSQARDILLATGDVQIDEWKTYRALVLLVMMQPARTHASIVRNDDWLAKLLVSDKEVDQLVRLYMQGTHTHRAAAHRARNGLKRSRMPS